MGIVTAFIDICSNRKNAITLVTLFVVLLGLVRFGVSQLRDTASEPAALYRELLVD